MGGGTLLPAGLVVSLKAQGSIRMPHTWIGAASTTKLLGGTTTAQGGEAGFGKELRVWNCI